MSEKFTGVDRRYLEASPYGQVALSPDLIILEMNHLYCEITGRARDDVLGKYLFDAFPAPEPVNAETELLKTVATVVSTQKPVVMPVVRHDFPIDSGGYHARYWQLTITPWIDGENVQFVIQQAEDVTARILREKAHQVRQRAASAGANLAFWDYNLVTRDSIRSEAFNALHGLRHDDASEGMDIFRNVHPEDRGELEQVLQDAARQREGDVDTGYRVVIGDDTRWLIGRSEVAYIPGSDHPHLIGTVIDVTAIRENEAELKASVEERDLLIAEVNHRVKNSLQIVTSILNLEAKSAASEETRDGLLSAGARVQAIATIHASLYEDDDVRNVQLDNYLRRFCQHLTISLGAKTRDVSLNIDADPIKLPTDKAITLSLAVNELITNAFRHAFPDNQPGRIDLSLKKKNDNHVVLQVADNGNGNGNGNGDRSLSAGSGLGTRLISGSVRQLGGELEQSGDEQGWRTRIEFSF
ncbi:MAG: histidine kinase dimerization/phosphoacceptor domain -containing protein [Pacificimonas sp.]